MAKELFTRKQMENAVMLAADLYQRMYNSPETDGGALEVAGTIIEEAVNMETWLTEKYGEDDDCYLDRLEEYEAMVVKKYGLEPDAGDGDLGGDLKEAIAYVREQLGEDRVAVVKAQVNVCYNQRRPIETDYDSMITDLLEEYGEDNDLPEGWYLEECDMSDILNII